MYILSILLAKYTEMKVPLKSRKTMAYSKTYDDQGLAISTMQLKDIARFESTTKYDKNINQGDLISYHVTSYIGLILNRFTRDSPNYF